jgi:hypothetical protein
MHQELRDVEDKLYTRDLYERDWEQKWVYSEKFLKN